MSVVLYENVGRGLEYRRQWYFSYSLIMKIGREKFFGMINMPKCYKVTLLAPKQNSNICKNNNFDM